MSSSPATRTSISGFRRRLVATIVVLALACAALGTASVLQGPRIQGARLDTAAAVVAPSSLRIVMDEAVAPLGSGDVSVTPAVPITVQNDGDVVLVHFGAALDYDTAYTVTLEGVHSATGGVSVDLKHEVTTPPLQITWLERDPAGDRIQSGTPGGEASTLYTAARIQDYLVLDPTALLVVTVDGTGASSASIVATDGSGNEEQLTLPGGAPGTIGLLELAGTDVLYTFTTRDDESSAGLPQFDQTLFRLDLAGTHVSDPVTDLDGGDLAVDTLIPVPGSTQAILHTRAGDVLTYDPAQGEPPVLVAKYAQLDALAGDLHRLSVTDVFGPLIYDLDDGSETRVTPSPIETSGAVPLVDNVVPVRDGRYVEQALVPAADYSSFDTFLAIDDGSQTRLLYDTREATGSILNMRVTPNDRYLVTETSPGGADFDTSDGYEVQPRPRDVTTVIVDIVTGEVVAEFPGSHARWPGGTGTRE